MFLRLSWTNPIAVTLPHGMYCWIRTMSAKWLTLGFLDISRTTHTVRICFLFCLTMAQRLAATLLQIAHPMAFLCFLCGGRRPRRWTRECELLFRLHSRVFRLSVLAMPRFTTKADVWSYAVTVYEIFTNGARPYGDIPNAKVWAQVQVCFFCLLIFFFIPSYDWSRNPTQGWLRAPQSLRLSLQRL